MTHTENDPLEKLPRLDAELGGLDLFARLDDASIATPMADAERVQVVIDRFRDGVLTSLRNPARVHGWHVQAMFGEVARSLGAPLLIAEDDAGAAWSRRSSPVKPSDYRIVLTDRTVLAVEVKNHHSADPAKPVKLGAKELAGLQRYADLTRARAMLAIYWTGPGLWILIDADRFVVEGTKAKLDVLEALADNEMGLLGDVMIGTVPPLEFVVDVQEEASSPGPEEGTRLATVRITKAKVLAGGQTLRPVEQRLAFYMMWNGKWPETQDDRFRNGKLVQIRFRYEPEEWPTEQGFAIVGNYSELFSRSFLMRTSEGEDIRRLSAKLDPRAEGFEIPASYKSDRLPIWRFHLQPRSAGSNSVEPGG